MCSLAAECHATEGIHMLRISVVSKGRHREEHTEIGIAILGGCTDWKDQIFHITSSNQGSLNTLRIQRLESKFCHYLEKCPSKSSESFVGGERVLAADITSWSLRPPCDVPVVGSSDEWGLGSQDLRFFAKRLSYPEELELYKNHNYLFVYVYVCCVHAHMCHGMYSGVRGQPLGVGLTLTDPTQVLDRFGHFSGPQRASFYLLKNTSKRRKQG